MAEQNRASSFVRVVRTKTDPTKLDESIKHWTQEILPILKKQKGFAGASLTGNRKTGDGLTVTYWESETAMKEARGQVRPEALKVLAKNGGSIVEDDECQVAMLERFQSPKAHVWSRITTVQGDPAQLDRSIANFKEKIVPAIQKQHGARTALFFVNRQSGKTFAGSVWDTEQDLQKSEAAISQLRTEAVKNFGGRDVKTEIFEIYFTEIPTPASVR